MKPSNWLPSNPSRLSSSSSASLFLNRYGLLLSVSESTSQSKVSLAATRPMRRPLSPAKVKLANGAPDPEGFDTRLTVIAGQVFQRWNMPPPI